MAAEHGRAEGESMAAAARSCRSRGGGVDGGGEPPLGRWMDWSVREERKKEADDVGPKH